MKRMLVLLLVLTMVMIFVSCANDTSDEPAGDLPADSVNGVTEDDSNGEDVDEEAEKELDAAALIAMSCTGCHGDAQIYTNRDNDKWPELVRGMAANTSLDQEEIETIILYLQENYSN